MSNVKSMADYWDALTGPDKQYIISLAQTFDPNKYNGLHLGILALMDVQTVKTLLKLTHTWENAYSKKAKKRILHRLRHKSIYLSHAKRCQHNDRKYRKQQRRKLNLKA